MVVLWGGSALTQPDTVACQVGRVSTVYMNERRPTGRMACPLRGSNEGACYMRVLISSNPENLRAEKPCVTIEAEYGGVVVEGALLTLAHHGSRGHNPPPSTRPTGRVDGAETIGISHVDLDTLGGIMSVRGDKPEAPSFWELAGYVDLNGAHKLGASGASEADLRRLYAYWAASAEIRVYPPRDGSVADVTALVDELAAVVLVVLADDQAALEAGDAFKAAEDKLNADSFLALSKDGVVMRSSAAFVNHLYVTPDGQVARACVTHNPSEDLPGGAITASLADPIPGVNVGELLGRVFGPEAGGHAGIGGSERGKVRPFNDAETFAAKLAEAMAAKV